MKHDKLTIINLIIDLGRIRQIIGDRRILYRYLYTLRSSDMDDKQINKPKQPIHAKHNFFFDAFDSAAHISSNRTNTENTKIHLNDCISGPFLRAFVLQCGMCAFVAPKQILIKWLKPIKCIKHSFSLLH